MKVDALTGRVYKPGYRIRLEMNPDTALEKKPEPDMDLTKKFILNFFLSIWQNIQYIIIILLLLWYINIKGGI